MAQDIPLSLTRMTQPGVVRLYCFYCLESVLGKERVLVGSTGPGKLGSLRDTPRRQPWFRLGVFLHSFVTSGSCLALSGLCCRKSSASLTGWGEGLPRCVHVSVPMCVPPARSRLLLAPWSPPPCCSAWTEVRKCLVWFLSSE